MSGAPKPGGFIALPSGGVSAPSPGGIEEDNSHLSQLARSPDFDISPGDNFGSAQPRVNQVRGVVNLRLGKATAVTSYAWTLPTRPGGSTATVNNNTTPTANFTPDLAGEYILQVVVTLNDTPATVITKQVKFLSA